MNELEKLQQAINALEAQRATLGDSVVEAALGPLREKFASVQASLNAPQGGGEKQQRKVITVLFADLPGFSALAETMDAEDVREMMNKLWKNLDAIIVGFRGRVDKHIGEGVMALWGAEVANEDDPEQAIYAALEMRAQALEFAQRNNIPFQLRVGINTGPAIVGLVGTTGEFTALGDSVNLAARLDQAAPAGGILISHETFRMARGVFDVDMQDPITVKGKAEPVQTYLVVASRPRAFRLYTRGVEGVETKMVGRDKELSALQDAVTNMPINQRPEAITVVGDAGVGKSRLLFEFMSWFDIVPETWWVFQGRASFSTSAAPYALLRDIFSFRFEIQDNDSLAVAHQKLERGISHFMPDDPRIEEKAHFIGHLIGLDYVNSPYLQGVLADPRQMRSLTLTYITQFFASAARHQPAMLLLDDVHWADTASLDVLSYVYANLPDKTKLFMLLMSRPTLYERYPQWGEGLANHTRIDLQLLTKDDSRKLVAQILQKVKEIPTVVQELVVGGAEGNPFYLEELIKMLIDSKVIQPGDEEWRVEVDRLAATHIPATLTGVLQARLDSLEATERLALQRASVIGRVFWDQAVEALPGDAGITSATLKTALKGLRNKELIFDRNASAFSETQEYIFKNIMLRDVTYETVLKRQRSAYHIGFADWLNAVSGERRGEYLTQISEHYEKGGELRKAISTLIEAGERSIGLSAFQSARSFLTRASEMLFNSEQTANFSSTTITNIELRLGEVHFRLGDYAEAQTHTQTALIFARRSKTPASHAAALTQLGQISAEMGDYLLAETHLIQALELARQGGEQAKSVLARTLFNLGNIGWRLNKLQEAVNYCKESETLAGEINDPHTLLQAMNRLGVLSGMLGNPEEEEKIYRKVLALAVSVGNRERAAVALNNLGALADENGKMDEAKAHYLQALDLAREIGAQQSQALYLVNLGHSELKLKDYQNAKVNLCEGMTIAERIGAQPWLLMGLMFYAQLIGDLGNKKEALTLLGVAKHHHAFSSDHQRMFDQMLAEWLEEPDSAQAEIQAGASLNFENVIRDVLKQTGS